MNWPVIWVAAPAAGAQLGLHRRGGDHLAVEQDRDPLVAGRVRQARSHQRRATAGRPAPLKATETTHWPTPSCGLLGAGVLDAVAVEELRTDQDRLAVLVDGSAVAPAGALLAGLGGTAHDVEAELGGPPDHLGRLAGVLDAGQLDDDPRSPDAGQGRLGDPERVDPAAQHLERPVGGLARPPSTRSLSWVSSTIWVPPSRSRPSRGDRDRAAQQGEPDDHAGR